MPKENSEQSHSIGALVKEFRLLKQAMAGDMVFVVSPATHTRKATAAAWSRKVFVELQNAKGERHTWFDGDISIGIADNSVAGAATIHGGDTTPAMSKGRVEIQVDGSAAAWLANETNTLTVNASTIFGYSVTSKTSVETIIA